VWLIEAVAAAISSNKRPGSLPGMHPHALGVDSKTNVAGGLRSWSDKVEAVV
jgi:hypothetical protein